MHLIKAHGLQKPSGALKLLLCLSRKTGNHIRGNGRMVKGLPEYAAASEIILRGIMAVHPF